MELFVDSDLANKATDRRSVSSTVMLFAGPCVLCLLCRTQKSVALSSTEEAEYVAVMSDGMNEAIVLRYLWSIIFPDTGFGVCFVDSRGQRRR